MIVIGVTGSLASGKSEIAQILKKRGAKVFDADLSARRVIKKGTPTHQAVVKLFGKEFVGRGGEINRLKLAERVFSNPKDLKKLNILVHPQVIFDCLRFIEKLRDKKGFLILDVPLLFESRMGSLADYTLLVGAPQSRVFERAKKRGMSQILARKILASQWPISKKKRLADFYIENSGSLKDLEKKVFKVIEQIKRKGA